MKALLNIEGKSQYSHEVDPRFQPTACGPTTANILLSYICHEKKEINELYQVLGTSKIGTFKWQMVRNLQRLLGDDWLVADCTINEAMEELKNGRPVAMKVDKYTTFKWFSKPPYRYHWVPVIGYEIRAGKLYLLFHDNGGRNRKSAIKEMAYEDYREFLSFVKITPNPFKKDGLDSE